MNPPAEEATRSELQMSAGQEPSEQPKVAPRAPSVEESTKQTESSTPPGAHHRAILEALLFAAEKPLSARQLAEMIGEIDARQVRHLVDELRREYDEQGRAFQIEEIAEGFQLLTRPEFRNWVLALRRGKRDAKLSEAAIETLAIVAYKQPITRARIEDIRGVQSDHLLRALMEKRLVRIVGRDDAPGRPLLYGTTKEFLEHFGLKSLKDLPTSRDLPAIK